MHLSVPISILMTTGVVLGYEFSGDGTYYGGAGAGGSCTQTYVPEGFKTVAMNDPMYDGGMVCGSCLEAVLHIGGESQYFEAIVDNKCPECAFGDLDLGESGDGRWDIEWSFIPCPELDEPVITTQGSNPFYAKIKVEGFGGVTDMKVNGNQATGTDDGYWVVSDGSGSLGCGATLDTKFSDGSSMELCADGTLFGGGCSGSPSCSANAPAKSGFGEIEEESGEESEEKSQESEEKPLGSEEKPEETDGKPQESEIEEEKPQESEIEEEKPQESEIEEENPQESEEKPLESEEKPSESEEKPGVHVSPQDSKCVDLYQQCGGKEFKGSDCCLYEAECVLQSDWYSNCVPDPNKGSRCQTKWNQCDGVGWTGLKCCKEGLECTFKNDWYSQCL